MANATLALAYATLILVDGKKDLSKNNLQKLVTSAGAKVDEQLTSAFARGLEGKNVSSWFNVSSGAAAPVAKAAEKPAAKAVEKVVEKAPEPEEDMDMGGFFGDD